MSRIFSDQFTVSQVISVPDGDSFRCTLANCPGILGDRVRVRIAEIDTPEMAASSVQERNLAIRARGFLAKMIQEATVIRLSRCRRDKYFRILAAVECDGVDVASELIRHGHARRYTGGPRGKWS